MIEATPTAATAAAKLRDVPEPELSFVANATGFPTFRCQKLGPGREYFDTLVLKASYPLRPGVLGEPVNQPIVVADRWWNEAEPLGSSLKSAGEVVLEKPAGDVFLTGHARVASPMTRSEDARFAHARGNGPAELGSSRASRLVALGSGANDGRPAPL